MQTPFFFFLLLLQLSLVICFKSICLFFFPPNLCEGGISFSFQIVSKMPRNGRALSLWQMLKNEGVWLKVSPRRVDIEKRNIWDGGGKTFSPVEGAKDRTRKVEPRCFKLAFRGSERKLEDRWWLFQQYSHQLAKCFSLFNFDLLLFNSPMLHPLRGISFSPFSACNSREAIQSVSLSREFWFSGWLAHSQTHGIASSPSFRNYWHTQNHFPP